MSNANEPKIAAARTSATLPSQPDEAKKYMPSEDCRALMRGNWVPADLRQGPPDPFSRPKPEPTHK